LTVAYSAWRRFLCSRWAPLLTHGSLVASTVALFALLLGAPFWLALVPCAILEHRIGILIHEYIHGIPFRRHRWNTNVITVLDGLLLCFGLLEVFRNSHLAHHRRLNTEQDPAWSSAENAMKRPRLSSALLNLELPQHAAYLWSALFRRQLRVRPLRIIAGALMSVGWIAFWIAIGKWWMWPTLQGLVFFTAAVPSSLRGAVEHHSFVGDPRFANEYRSFIPLFNLNRHVHHHLDPRCPWYLLTFITPNPLPARCFITHWLEVYVRRRYTIMQPMGHDWCEQIERGAAMDACLSAAATRRSSAGGSSWRSKKATAPSASSLQGTNRLCSIGDRRDYGTEAAARDHQPHFWPRRFPGHRQ
jgi:fatty acid desaturase